MLDETLKSYLKSPSIWIISIFYVACSQSSDLSDLKLNESIGAITGSSEIRYRRSMLNDSINNEIVKLCITGADSSQLLNYNISNLNERLSELIEGNMISRQSDQKYYPTFPILTGSDRKLLENIAYSEARKLIPFIDQLATELRVEYGITVDKLFHMLWSRIMDRRIVWDNLWQTKFLNEKFPYTFWVVYPKHSFTCGTNYYGFVEGDIAISWGPSFKQQLDKIPNYKYELFSTSIKREIKDPESKNEFIEMGMTDINGDPKYAVLLQNDSLSTYCWNEAIKYANEIEISIDFSNPFNPNRINDGQYLIILLHEISYCILEDLHESQIIEFPAYSSETEPDKKDYSNLVSVITEIPENHIDEAMALYQLNGWRGNEEIVLEFQNVFNENPSNYNYLFFYGLALYDVGNFDLSIDIFKNYLKKMEIDSPDLLRSDWSHIWIGHNYDKLGKREKAIEYYQMVVNFTHKSGKMQMLQYGIKSTTAYEWATERLVMPFSTGFSF